MINLIFSMALLSYPSLGIRLSVQEASPVYWEQKQWNALERNMQDIMESGAAKYPKINVIAGHSSPPQGYKGMMGSAFAPLVRAKAGQNFLLRGKAGNTRYQVYKTEIVHPSKVSILNVPENEIRLQTCYPIGSTRNRLIIYARINP